VQQFALVENVLQKDSKFDFPSPLIRNCYLQHKYGTNIPPTQIKTNFDEFLKDVFAKMDGVTLKNCRSKSKNSRLLEAAYQHEFYRAATGLLGVDGIVSCEVGALYSIHGRIDFFINDKRNWAVELLRDGDRLNDHVARMAPGGKYDRLTITASNTVVIDLRGPSSPQPNGQPPEGVVYAVFEKEFRYVTVIKSNGTSFTITLVS